MFSDHTLKIHKNNFIYKLSEAALLLVIGGYVLVSDVVKATLRLGITDQWEKYVIYALVPTILFRLLVVLLQEKEERKTWLGFIAAALIVDAVYFMTHYSQQNQTILFIAILTLGTIGLEYGKILKVYIAAAAAVLFPAIFLAWAGEIENYVYVREMTIRSSWGIKYPTDLMSLLFFLCLAVWIAAKDKNDLWFLVPGGILTVMAYSVADSRTGVLCGVVLMIVICISYLLSRKRVKILRKIIEFCACAAFSAFTVLMNALMFAYRAGNPIAVKVNGAMSNRLALAAQALNDYGLSLFGKPIPQVGHGGSAFIKPDYYFIDTSYHLILLQFGIVTLIMVNILWVLLTRKAFRIGDTRLGLALAMVAFNAITEHHIMQPNYDVFIIMPFAILAAPKRVVEKPYRAAHAAEDPRIGFKGGVSRIAAVMVLAAASIGVFFALLPMARTVFSILNIGDRTTERKLTWLICIGGLCMVVLVLHSLFALMTNKENRKKPQRAKYIAAITAFCIVLAAGVVYANIIIGRGAEKNADMVASEKEAIEIVNSSKSGKFYVSDLPSIYNRTYGGVSTSLFNGEELGRYNNASVVMDVHTDSPCFFNTGFLYTPISDKHALFTNDRAVSEALQDAGYHLTAYYPVLTNVDMQDEAKRNNRDLNEDGSITLKGEKKKLRKGPRADLRAGRYTFTYDLAIDEASLNNKAQNPDGACRLKVTYYKGKYLVSEVTIDYDQFDKNGNAHIEQVCDMPDAENTDIKVLPIGNNVITVKGISYQKTPEKDTHYFYDSNRVRIREEYYDLGGEPYEGVWGYVAKDIGHDRRGNTDHEIYYGRNGQKTINAYGYSEIRKKYNSNNLIEYQEYYGIDGERTSLPAGQSAEKYEYDVFGRLTGQLYFDTKDNPTMVGGPSWGGYSKAVRNYDENGRISREEFFDTENLPVEVKEGYSSREFKYDDNGNCIDEIYYGQDGRKTMIAVGYSEIKREYNANNQKMREEYYDADGKRVVLENGQSAISYKYDAAGNNTETSYFDAQDEPSPFMGEKWGGYHKVVKDYDEHGRVTRERYYDAKGDPVMAKEGYASRELEYDDRGNTAREVYYDQNHNKVINRSGMCDVRKEYDSNNKVIRDSYYGPDGKRMTIPAGQAIAEYKYTKNGSLAEVSYYDTQGSPTLVGGETWGGYHKLKIEYDTETGSTREEYFGTDDKPVMIKQGYSVREVIYDDNHKIADYKYYDSTGKVVPKESVT